MNPLAIGDTVELLAIPSQVIQDRAEFPETYGLLSAAVGRAYAIKSFNNYLIAELWLNDDASEDPKGIHHSVWIEPEYLQKMPADLQAPNL